MSILSLVRGETPGVLSMKRFMLQDTLAGVAKILSQLFNMTVKFGSQSAYASKDGISLPHLPLDLNALGISVVKGNMVHETAHKIFTDFSVFDRPELLQTNPNSKSYKDFWNCLEDPWINSKISLKYPGTRAMLMDGYRAMQALGQIRTGAAGTRDALSVYILTSANWLMMRDGFYPPRVQVAVGYLKQFIGDELADKLITAVDAEVGKLPQCKSSHDVFEIAVAIHAIVKEIQDQLNAATQQSQQDADQEDSGQENDNTDGGTGSGEGEDDDQGESASGNSSSLTEPGESGGDQHDAKPEQGEDGAGASGKPEPTSQSGEPGQPGKPGQPQAGNGDPSASADPVSGSDGGGVDASGNLLGEPDGEEIDNLKGIVDQIGDETKDCPLLPSTDSSTHDKACCSGAVVETFVKTNIAAYNAVMGMVSSEVGVMSSQLMRLLRSRDHVTRVTTNKPARIRAGKIARVAYQSDPVIYGHKIKTEHASAAVSVLMDLSSSTQGPVSQLILQTAVLLGEAMNVIGNPTEIIGFGQPALSQGKARLIPFKSFNQPYQARRAELGSALQYVDGYTPMGRALEETLTNLMLRKEQKKLCFVLTDGDTTDIEERSIQMVTAAHGSGMQVHFLLMDSDVPLWMKRASDQCLINFYHVPDAQSLPGTVLQILERDLL